MANKITNSYRLAVVAGFADGDERTISIEDPREDVTASDINALNTVAAEVLIGDKYGASFTVFKGAKKIQQRVTEYEISSPT